MKTLDTLDLDQPLELHTFLDDGTPFVINGPNELLIDMDAADKTRREHITKQTVPQPVVEAPVTASKPEPEPISLADLDAREIARLERKAVWHDIRTLGRTSMHKLFIEKLHEEQDAKMMMELGIVEAVHCRLHERMVAKARGLR